MSLKKMGYCWLIKGKHTNFGLMYFIKNRKSLRANITVFYCYLSKPDLGRAPCTLQWMWECIHPYYLTSDFNLLAILSGIDTISVMRGSHRRALPSCLQSYIGTLDGLYMALCSCRILPILRCLKNCSKMTTHLFSLKLGLKWEMNWEI